MAKKGKSLNIQGTNSFAAATQISSFLCLVYSNAPKIIEFTLALMYFVLSLGQCFINLMTNTYEPGLGELLRHLTELTDDSSTNWYKDQGFNYRPRYTPIMRALVDGPASVTDLKERLSVTQGAISQTIKLMLEDHLIEKKKGQDGRQSIVNLTPHGQKILEELKPHWEAIFDSIKSIEQEIRLPLMASLKKSVNALEETSFAERIKHSKETPRASCANDHKHTFFQTNGDRYLKFRPRYPSELAQCLSALTKAKDLALDVGCGNGQLTNLLAAHFNQVIGVDPSATQINQADDLHNLSFYKQPAENIELADNSVDLVVAAQSAHWFDLDAFYSEALRVAKDDAVIALVSYGVPYIEGPVNAIFQKGYWQGIHEFWPPERKAVEDNYADLYFPFEALSFPPHRCRQAMTCEDFINYMSTWSAYSVAASKGELRSFEIFFNKLRSSWGTGQVLGVVWPISVKAANVNQYWRFS